MRGGRVNLKFCCTRGPHTRERLHPRAPRGLLLLLQPARGKACHAAHAPIVYIDEVHTQVAHTRVIDTHMLYVGSSLRHQPAALMCVRRHLPQHGHCAAVFGRADTQKAQLNALQATSKLAYLSPEDASHVCGKCSGPCFVFLLPRPAGAANTTRQFSVRMCWCWVTPPQVMLALVLLHQSVAAQEDTPRADQSPNVVKATIQVPRLIVAHRRV